jgi:uncharacterized Tic20 family protein
MVKPQSGGLAWALGLLVFAFFPFLSSVLAGIVMAVVGRSQRSKGPLAAENGRRAANWGLTYLMSTVVLIGTHFAVLFIFQDRIPNSFFPMGIFVTAWAAISLLHVIVSIAGLIVAERGRVFRWNGLPFLRAPRPVTHQLYAHSG